jgi:hypothetical protein
MPPRACALPFGRNQVRAETVVEGPDGLNHSAPLRLRCDHVTR